MKLIQKDIMYLTHNIIFIYTHACAFFQILNGNEPSSGQCKSIPALSSHLPSAFSYDKQPDSGTLGCGWALKTFIPRILVDVIAGLLMGISFYHTTIKKSKSYSYFNTILFVCVSLLVCWITFKDFSAVIKSYKWCRFDKMSNVPFEHQPTTIECKYGSFFLTCSVDLLLLICVIILPFSNVYYAKTFGTTTSTTKKVNGSDYVYEKFTPSESYDDDEDSESDSIDVKFKGSEKKPKKLLMTGYDIDDDDDDDNDDNLVIDFTEQSKKRFPPHYSNNNNNNNKEQSPSSSSSSSEIDFTNVKKWTRTVESDTNDDDDESDFDFESFSNNN